MVWYGPLPVGEKCRLGHCEKWKIPSRSLWKVGRHRLDHCQMLFSGK